MTSVLLCLGSLPTLKSLHRIVSTIIEREYPDLPEGETADDEDGKYGGEVELKIGREKL